MAVGKDKVTGKWYTKFRFHDLSGKAIQKRKIGFAKRADALAWEKEFIAAHEGRERLTFKQAYERYIEDCKKRLKKSTYMIKEQCLGYYTALHNLVLAEITPATIRRWQNEYLLKTNDDGKLVFAKNTIKTRNGHLAAFFAWAVRFCGLKSNPVKLAGPIKTKKRKDEEEDTKIKNIWQLEDFNRFIETVRKPDYHLIFSILFFCGLRRGECLGLRIKDVDLENGVLHVVQNVTFAGIDTPKTKSSRRTVSIPDVVKTELAEYIGKKYKPSPTQLLFYRSPDGITGFFAHKQAEIGMTPRIRLHDLRHSHASMLINLGFSPDVVADRLGHKDATMVLAIYGHMYPQRRVEVTNALNKAVARVEKKSIRKSNSKKVD